jgi:sugar phosphate isomerase/epimerase
VAEHVPFRFLIQHIGLPNESFSERKFEAAMTSVEHLRAFAKPLGVRLLVENIPNELSTPERLVEFIRTSHMDDVGVCFDTGHANMMGDVASAFETVKITSTRRMYMTMTRSATRTCGRAMELLIGNPHWNC